MTSASDILQYSSKNQLTFKTLNTSNNNKNTMLKFIALFCIISAAKAGILSPSVSIATAPTIVSAPSINILRASPIALGTTIGAPLRISSGLISNGLVSNGLISNGLVSGGLISNGIVSGGLVTKGLVSGGLISGGLVGGGKLLI